MCGCSGSFKIRQESESFCISEFTPAQGESEAIELVGKLVDDSIA